MPPRVKKTEQNLTDKKNITRKNKNVESVKELDGVPLESVSEPVIAQLESVFEPPSEPVPEPSVEPVLEPPVEPIPELPSESVSEVAESVPEPPSEPVPEQPVESVPEPRSEPVPEPPSESVPKYPSEPVPETSSESVSEVAGVFRKLQQPSVSPAASHPGYLTSEDRKDGDIQALLGAAETVPDPSVEHPFEPLSEVPEPPSESIHEPLVEPVLEPPDESIHELSSESIPGPPSDSIPIPPSESILETIPGPPSVVFHTLHQPAASPQKIMHKLPISGEPFPEPVPVDVTVQQVIQTLSESSIVVPEVINTNIENETPKNEIDDVIKELSTSNRIKIIKPEYELDTSEVNNILKDIETNNSLFPKNDLVQIKEVFDKFTHSALLFQVKDGNIKYIEKKGKELRNQSIIDLIQDTHKTNPLPNKTFIVYTNNFNLNSIDNDSLLSVFGSKPENAKLFPSYVFNYFKKNNNIYSFKNITKTLQENSIQWNEKKEQIYISESKINSVINNLYTSSVLGLKKNISGNKNFAFNEEFEKIKQYKYIISVNTSENSYLLPFYLSSGSCIIIMKNNNKALYLEEFYYKEFIAGEDYIEINYDNNESGESMIEKINNALKSSECEEIAKRCFEKSKKIFNIDNIYSHIHQQISSLPDDVVVDVSGDASINSEMVIEHNMFYTGNSQNFFFKNRLFVSNNNSVKFNYQGSDVELRLLNNVKTGNEEQKEKSIIIKVLNNNTTLYYNQKMFFNRQTPHLLLNNKYQQYEIIIENNMLKLVVENKFTLLNVEIPEKDFTFSEVEIKSESDGSWIV
jgi:hypothetical protein